MVVSVLCVILNLPSVWQFRITEYEDDQYLIDIGLLDLSNMYGKAYMWIRAIFAIFIPAVLLVYCNMSLISALKRSHNMHRGCYVTRDTRLNNRNKLTAMLVVIATTFIILVFPSEIMDFFHDVTRKGSSQNVEVFMFIRAITNVFQVMNFTCNFAMYCVLNVHFRGVLRHLVCYCKAPLTGDNPHSDLDKQCIRLARFSHNGSTKTCLSVV
jgi:hypothetical protein